MKGLRSPRGRGCGAARTQEPAQAATEVQRRLPAEAPASPVLVLPDVTTPGLDGMGFPETYQQLPPVQQAAAVIVTHTASLNFTNPGRVESLPTAGLVGKPLTTEKVDSMPQVPYRRLPDADEPTS